MNFKLKKHQKIKIDYSPLGIMKISFKLNNISLLTFRSKRRIAMKKSNGKERRNHKKVNKEMTIVTVDIGKRVNTGYFRFPDGTDTETFPFMNNGRGFNKLLNRIEKCMMNRSIKKKDIVIGFESTGCYWEPFANYFDKRSFNLVLINAAHTKRVKELDDNSPNKTDKKDPRVIADIICLGHTLSVIVPEGAAAEIRNLLHTRERQNDALRIFYNQVESIYFPYFPEFFQMFNLKTKTALYLLRNYPTPEVIVDCGLEKLTQEMRKVSRGQFDRERAELLMRAAKSSAGIKAGRESVLIELEILLNRIDEIESFMEEVEERMAYYVDQISYSKYILSIKGVGLVTTATVIGELADVNAFSKVRQIIKVAGLNLYEKSSGEHKGERHIAKRGRPLLRAKLYLAAVNTVKKGGIMHDKYQSLIKRGLPKPKALIAISKNLLRIIFALVREQSYYIEDYSKSHKSAKKAA